MGFDDLTWQALGAALTLVGLTLSVLLWRRRGAATGLRAAAWSLLPLAAALTGTLRLVGEVAEAVTRWATRLVLSPTVWLGLVLAGVAAVLFTVSAVLRRRVPRAVGAGPRPGPPDRGLPSGPGSAGTDDMADIEAILRRHGIE